MPPVAGAVMDRGEPPSRLDQNINVLGEDEAGIKIELYIPAGTNIGTEMEWKLPDQKYISTNTMIDYPEKTLWLTVIMRGPEDNPRYEHWYDIPGTNRLMIRYHSSEEYAKEFEFMNN